MKPVILIGSRQDNRQVAAALESTGQHVYGIVDRFYQGQVCDGIDVIGSDLELADTDSDLYRQRHRYDWFINTLFTGITNPNNDDENTWALRKQRIDLAERANLNLINIIHKSAYVDPSANLGKNILVGWNSYIGGNCVIGDYTYIAAYVGLAHHITVGRNCTLIGHMGVAGNITIGNNVFIAHGTTLSRRGKSKTTIGDNVIIGPGCCIVKSVPDNKIVLNDGKTLPNTNYVD